MAFTAMNQHLHIECKINTAEKYSAVIFHVSHTTRQVTFSAGLQKNIYKTKIQK